MLTYIDTNNVTCIHTLKKIELTSMSWTLPSLLAVSRPDGWSNFQRRIFIWSFASWAELAYKENVPYGVTSLSVYKYGK